jgi:hypothetical protein
MTPADNQAPRAGRALLTRTLVFATAGLALLAVGLGLRVMGLRTENDALTTERQLAEVAYKSSQTQLKERSLLAETMINELGRQLRAGENVARLQVIALARPADDHTRVAAIVVWDPVRQVGLLTIEGLPPNDDDRDYQLWLVEPASAEPIRGCVFHVGPGAKSALTFKPDRPATAAAAFVVSLEKKGGSAKLEGPTVLTGR